MNTSQPKVLFTEDKRAAQAFALAALVPPLSGSQDTSDGDARVLHPLIYPGIWKHPSYGDFEVTSDDIDMMLAAFRAGVPTQLGIPIDERAEHSPNPDGAYGWIKDLVVQTVDGHPGVLCGAIEWTAMGKAKVESNEMPFISAHFLLGDEPDAMYGATTLIHGAALTARPFFWQQPGLQIAASAYALSADSDAGGDAQSTGGATTMDATTARTEIAEARGVGLTDEEWTALSAGVEDFDGLIAAEKAKLETEPPGATVESPVETVVEAPPETPPAPEPPVETASDDAPPTRAEFEEMRLQMAEMAKTTKQAQEVAASANARLGDAEAREDQERETRVRAEIKGIVFDSGRRSIAASATDVLAAAYINPTRENMDALWAHIKQFGGLHTYIAGEIGAAAFGAAGLTDPEAQAAKLPVVQSVRDSILTAHMATNKPIDELYQEHLRKINTGG